jgi:hypothetical protein
MGCISSKQAVRAAANANAAGSSPVSVHTTHSINNNNNNNGAAMPVVASRSLRNHSGALELDSVKIRKEEGSDDRSREVKKSKKDTSRSHSKSSFSFKLGFSHRHVQAEQAAAGWPTWLTAAADEDIIGWIPLRADSFEKLEKVWIVDFKAWSFRFFVLYAVIEFISLVLLVSDFHLRIAVISSIYIYIRFCKLI